MQELIDEGLYDSHCERHRRVCIIIIIYINVLTIKVSTSRHCLAYCYAGLLRDSLSEFVTLWNSHKIRKNQGARCPSGVPDILYSTPEIAGIHLVVYEEAALLAMCIPTIQVQPTICVMQIKILLTT